MPSLKAGFDVVPEREGTGAKLQYAFTRGMRLEAAHE